MKVKVQILFTLQHVKVCLGTVQTVQEESILFGVCQLNRENLLAGLLSMQNHLYVQVMIVVFTVRATLNPYILLMVIENLIKFEACLKLIRLSWH